MLRTHPAEGQFFPGRFRSFMSDQDLRQALLGTWRLISCQEGVDGTLVKPFGDDPQGYLVYINQLTRGR